MRGFRVKTLLALAVALAATFAAGCTTTGTTGGSSPARNSRGGGWENFRAAAPILQPLSVT